MAPSIFSVYALCCFCLFWQSGTCLPDQFAGRPARQCYRITEKWACSEQWSYRYKYRIVISLSVLAFHLRSAQEIRRRIVMSLRCKYRIVMMLSVQAFHLGRTREVHIQWKDVIDTQISVMKPKCAAYTIGAKELMNRCVKICIYGHARIEISVCGVSLCVAQRRGLYRWHFLCCITHYSGEFIYKHRNTRQVSQWHYDKDWDIGALSQCCVKSCIFRKRCLDFALWIFTIQNGTLNFSFLFSSILLIYKNNIL